MRTTIDYTVQDRYKNILGVYDDENVARDHAKIWPGQLRVTKTTTVQEVIVEIAPESGVHPCR